MPSFGEKDSLTKKKEEEGNADFFKKIAYLVAAVALFLAIIAAGAIFTAVYMVKQFNIQSTTVSTGLQEHISSETVSGYGRLSRLMKDVVGHYYVPSGVS